MARVNVDSQALSDARFGVLAGLMGVDDPDYALGRMVRVWAQCIERETYVITKPVIVALFKGAKDAPEWLLSAELADSCEGGLRIKGTKGRIEYLAEKRANARRNGSLGGRPTKPTLVSSGNQRRGVVETPPAPALPPAPLVPTPRSRLTIPPTLEDVQEYCLERKNSVDPQRFMDFYTAKGWKVGDQKMKDWKACVRTWENNERNNRSGNGTSRQPSRPTPAIPEGIDCDGPSTGPLVPFAEDGAAAMPDGSARPGPN